ncbi:hypothetical protein [Pseudarthrobacter sp. NamE5]|nr:hypothetical protein [Pseudarthrobacter sp. NamE5]
MPRFTNKLSGSVVNVSEAEAENLGPDYEPTKEKTSAGEKPARRASSAK